MKYTHITYFNIYNKKIKNTKNNKLFKENTNKEMTKNLVCT